MSIDQIPLSVRSYTHKYGNMARMKTTLELPDELLIAAKKKAAEQRRPLRALVEEGLRVVLEGPKRQDRKRTVRLVTVKGGLAPGLDLSNREAMLNWIEKHS
jgi:hypothetical protein